MARQRLRLMAVHAHPDDESSKGAASTARYVAEGVDVMVVTATGGERGDILNPAVDTPEVRANLAAVRQAEMAEAARILGVRHAWLGFPDSGFPEADPITGTPPELPEGCFADLPLGVVTAPLVELMRQFRPHVVTTYDEHGGYPHPDHVRTHEITVAAFDAAADPDRFPGDAEPWAPAKLYYHMTFHKARLLALHEAMLGAGLSSPYEEWLAGWEDRPHDAERLTTLVPCGDYFALRDDALRAHATQIDPSGRWFAVPLALQQAVWPTEDFQLARSLVPTTLPETDLFAGLRVGGDADDQPTAVTPTPSSQPTPSTPEAS